MKEFDFIAPGTDDLCTVFYDFWNPWITNRLGLSWVVKTTRYPYDSKDYAKEFGEDPKKGLEKLLELSDGDIKDLRARPESYLINYLKYFGYYNESR